MSYKYDGDELVTEIDKLKIHLGDMLLDMAETKNASDFILNNHDFKGEFAESLKAYYSEVHGKAIEIINSLLIGCGLMGERLKQDGLSLDNVSTAKIDTGYLAGDQKNQVLNAQKAYTENKNAVSKEVTAIADIVSISMPTESVEQKASDAINELSLIESKVSTYAEQTVVTEIRELLEQLGNLLNYMDSCQAPNGNVNYKPGDLARQPFYNKVQTVLDKAKGVWNTEAVKYSNDPVNLATGNLVYEKADISSGGFNPLIFKRFYNSIDSFTGVCGANWIHSFESKIISKTNESISIIFEDGHTETFIKDGTGRYSSSTLSKLSIGFGSYVLHYNGEERLYSENKGCLESIKQGNTITKLFYTDGNLSSIKRGENHLNLQYSSKGKLEEVKNECGYTVNYKYNNDELVKVISKEGTYVYEYNSKYGLTRAINPEGVVVLVNKYDEKNRTIKQTFADGSTMYYEYHDNEKKVVMIERNESMTQYFHDDFYRHTKIIHDDNTEETFEYNQFNRPTMQKDRNGNVTLYKYDSKGNRTHIINPNGSVRNFEYDYQNNVTSIRLENGATYDFSYGEYPNVKQLQKIITPNSNETTMSYDERGNLIKLIDVDSAVFKFTYDSKDNMSSFTNAQGHVTYYTYDDENNVTEVDHPNGGKEKFVYDDKNRLISKESVLGHITEYEYNTKDDITKITNPDGTEVCFSYNSLNKIERIIEGEAITKILYDKMWNIKKVIFPNGSSESYQYNKQNRLESYINQLGGIFEYTYDGNGNVISMANAFRTIRKCTYDNMNRVASEIVDSKTSTYEYDAVGNIVQQVDEVGNKQQFFYDLEGNCIKQVDVEGTTTQFTYTKRNQIQTITNHYGGVITYTYYPGGLVESIIQADQTKITYFYNEMNQIKSIVDAVGNETKYEYDLIGNIVKEIKPNNDTFLYSYDYKRNVTSYVTPNGETTFINYDQFNNITSVTDALGNAMEYSYDIMNNLTQVVERNSENTKILYKYAYNPIGQVTQILNNDGTIETQSYDKYGKLLDKTLRDQSKTQLLYDENEKLCKVLQSDGKTYIYKYNQNNQIEEVVDGQKRAHINYDNKGNIISFSDFEGQVTKYKYGNLNELLQVTYSDHSVKYTYDKHLNLLVVDDGKNKFNYTYDQMDRLQSRTSELLKTEYTYDANSRLKEFIHKNKDVVLDKYSYSYDGNNNITQLVKERSQDKTDSGVFSYQYDVLNRLISSHKNNELEVSFDYDLSGNRVQKITPNQITKYVYNNTNQLIEKVTGNDIVQYAYNARGLTASVTKNGILDTSYEYNHLGKMTKARTLNNEVQYAYNAFGKLISKQIDEHKTDFLVDHLKPINDIVAIRNNNTLDTFTYDGSGVIAQNDSSILKDHLGSVIGKISDSELEQYHYGLFGETETVQDNQLGYTGYLYDKSLNLNYAHARMYDQNIGRFMGSDKMTNFTIDSIGFNRYAYTGNRPTVLVDRDGNWPNLPSVGDVWNGAKSVGHGIKEGAKKAGDFVQDNIIGPNYVEEESLEGNVPGFEGGKTRTRNQRKPLIAWNWGATTGPQINVPSWLPGPGGSSANLNWKNNGLEANGNLNFGLFGYGSHVEASARADRENVLSASAGIGTHTPDESWTIGLKLGIRDTGGYSRHSKSDKDGWDNSEWLQGRLIPKYTLAYVLVGLALYGGATLLSAFSPDTANTNYAGATAAIITIVNFLFGSGATATAVHATCKNTN